MELLELQKWVYENLFVDGKLDPNKTKHLRLQNHNTYTILKDYTNFLDCHYKNVKGAQRIWHLMKDMKLHKCVCGNPTEFLSFQRGYKKYCSKQCRIDDKETWLSKYKQTNLKKYGVERPNELIRSKSKKTKLERYGDENYNNVEKNKQTKLEKYGNENYNNVEKHRQTSLKKYGVKHAIQLPESKEKRKQTCLQRYEVEHVLQSPEVRIQSKQTKLEKYGSENYNNMEKNSQTKLERYGDENYNNVEKAKQTNLQKYGVDHPCKSEEYLDRRKEETLEKYGVECTLQLSEVREQTKQSKLERYGDENYINIDKQIQTKIEKYGNINYYNKEKTKQTNLQRYGVPYVMQCAKIAEKSKGYKWHDYQLPSGEWTKLQGYEPQALDCLLQEYNEEDVLNRKSDMPEIWYRLDDDTWHRYYPDFYIPKDNLIIEVKSTWTYEYKLKVNVIKEEATRQMGYNYNLMIYDR